MSIVTAVAVVTVIGLLGAAILVVAAHFMHVEEDPRVGEVLGVLPGLVGCIQAAELLKMLLGTGGTLKGRMLFIDALQMRFEEMELPANPRCPLCGGGLRR